MLTPEGRVKARVNAIIKDCGGIYSFMPVQMGMGRSTLDFLLCVRGKFLAIETKARGNRMTLRQELTAGEIEGAGGTVWVIDENNVDTLPRRLAEFSRLQDD